MQNLIELHARYLGVLADKTRKLGMDWVLLYCPHKTLKKYFSIWLHWFLCQLRLWHLPWFMPFWGCYITINLAVFRFLFLSLLILLGHLVSSSVLSFFYYFWYKYFIYFYYSLCSGISTSLSGIQSSGFPLLNLFVVSELVFLSSYEVFFLLN